MEIARIEISDSDYEKLTPEVMKEIENRLNERISAAWQEELKRLENHMLYGAKPSIKNPRGIIPSGIISSGVS
jgi:hypothetical protein